MATVLIFDMIDWRLHETADLISGHRVMTTNDPEAALELATDHSKEVALVVADWTQSYGPKLIRRVYQAAKSVDLGFLLVRNCRPPKAQRRTELYDQSTYLGASGLVFRNRSTRRFRGELNTEINDILFLNWLCRISPFGFPFTGTAPSDPYAQFYLNSPFAEFIELMGGWEDFRDATEWDRLAGNDYRIDNLFCLLQRWANALDRDSDEFRYRVLLAHERAKRSPTKLRSRMIGELAEAVPLDSLVCMN
jgi:hypothetical protein